jgi:hypothetical protein
LENQPFDVRRRVWWDLRREGEGSVRINALDAAKNDVYSPIHNVRCVSP